MNDSPEIAPALWKQEKTVIRGIKAASSDERARTVHARQGMLLSGRGTYPAR